MTTATPKTRETFEPSLVMDGAMNPMMMSGTQNMMIWLSTYLTVTTTFMTDSFETSPRTMPTTTDTRRMKGRLVTIFFMACFP